ncbi:alpha/beta hydrolase-fold protein [Aliikangiella coralliicola]|uniref:Alpha/beta hydrolase n=1 Tax=Aliikangiella coralliicola TaxID=2592383 RepID=A0A545UI86_9GAMM|nr:alpha/beta hydrolase-fold protein [Aliikangiella coralliicola]TQV89177.1 alpha/beta hydrolase [Aliikangiella coralliicola]
MKLDCRLLIVLILVASGSFSNICDAQTARNSLESLVVESAALKEKRLIYVSKPLGYANSEERYSVVYVLDGESSIDYTKAVAEMLYQSGFPKLIVVAIPNTIRGRDLTPSAWREAQDGGGAENFLRFIKQELIPVIDKKYRTDNYRVLIGHSLGGLFATYALVKETQLFNALIAISPSVFYNDFSVMNQVEDLFEHYQSDSALTRLPEFHFAMGHEPGEEGDGILKMHQYFKQSAPAQMNWAFEYYPKENHTTVPLVATLDGLRFAFRDFNVPESIMDKGLDGLRKYFTKVSKKFGKNILVPQRVLMNLSDSQWSSGKHEDAILTARYYAEIYPDMIIPYDYLSDYYLRLGQIDRAIIETQNMLKVLPGFQHAEQKLKRLNEMKSKQ